MMDEKASISRNIVVYPNIQFFLGGDSDYDFIIVIVIHEI